MLEQYSLKKEALIKAMKKIDDLGIPKNDAAKKYVIFLDGNAYPPVYLLSMAYAVTYGRLLDSSEIRTERLLIGDYEKLGFETMTLEKYHEFQKAEWDKLNSLTNDQEKMLDDLRNNSMNLPELYKIMELRIEQSSIRERLMKSNEKCVCCDISSPDLLFLTSIIPYEYCEEFEIVDEHNYLLMCSHHKILFQKGYISFDADEKVDLAEFAKEQEIIFYNLNPFKEHQFSEGQTHYLDWHYDNVFNKKI